MGSFDRRKNVLLVDAIDSLPVAFFGPFDSVDCNFCCASLMASVRVCEFDRDLVVLLVSGRFKNSIGGGGGGGGIGMLGASFTSFDAPESMSVILALILIVALSWRKSSSAFSAWRLESSSSVSKSVIWIRSVSTSSLMRSCMSNSMAVFWIVLWFFEVVKCELLFENFTWNFGLRGAFQFNYNKIKMIFEITFESVEEISI